MALAITAMQEKHFLRSVFGHVGLSPIEEWVIEFEDVRGKENEARKVAMDLVRRCCDQTLHETARIFGFGELWRRGLVLSGSRVEDIMEFGVELSTMRSPTRSSALSLLRLGMTSLASEREISMHRLGWPDRSRRE